jgi:hypothetical protein
MKKCTLIGTNKVGIMQRGPRSDFRLLKMVVNIMVVNIYI